LEGTKSSIHLHPQQRNTAGAKQATKKFFQKNAGKIWWLQKLALPLQSVRFKKAAVLKKKKRRSGASR
jgi:hypothetical protein